MYPFQRAKRHRLAATAYLGSILMPLADQAHLGASATPHRSVVRLLKAHVATQLCLFSLLVLFGIPNAISDGSSASDYTLSTTQIPDPLYPLKRAQFAAEGIDVRSIVVTVADPLETHLGRVFDSQVSALISAFNVNDYVLDGFALTWRLPGYSTSQDPAMNNDDHVVSKLVKMGTASYTEEHRRRPSALVFRKDHWRTPELSSTNKTEYFVVFLVGESPTSGIHGEAFHSAVICATRLEKSSVQYAEGPCNIPLNNSTPFTPPLYVIGPAFSGSISSIVLELSNLKKDLSGLKVKLLSPTATVNSNTLFDKWINEFDQPSNSFIAYESMAIRLSDQLEVLSDFITQHAIKQNRNGDLRTVVLAEESTFGRSVTEIVNEKRKLTEKACEHDPYCDFYKNLTVKNFPQNIAAIRAERYLIDNQVKSLRRDQLKAKSQLLEFDLSGLDPFTDRPPSYRRAISSRSDELMLYGLLDNLRVWVDPNVVVIIATDVRDRIFLLNEIRKALPSALPVLMEMDFLTSHPDYRKITRGSLVIPNGQVRLCIESDECLSVCPALKDQIGRSYFTFPSDHAANMFRAAFRIIDPKKYDSCATTWPDRPGESERSRTIVPVVTTLAGFQEESKSSKEDGTPRSFLLAADSRIALEGPFSLIFLICALFIIGIGGWLHLHGRQHLVMMSALRHLNPFPGVREEDYCSAQGEKDKGSSISLEERLNDWLPYVLIVLGGIVVLLSGFRLYEIYDMHPRLRSWELPHGRDVWMLVSLLLLHICVTVIAAWRLALWRKRCTEYLVKLDKLTEGDLRVREQKLKLHGLVPESLVACAFGVLLMLGPISLWRETVTVDGLFPVLIFNVILLSLGIWFLIVLWSEWMRLSKLTLLLAPTVDWPTYHAKGNQQLRGWANPIALKEIPQTPFSLSFRKEDLIAVHAHTSEGWLSRTADMLKHRVDVGFKSDPAFLAWQSSLVAEMRYAVVAIRSCAWAAILTPTAILLGMSLYPPISERMLTTVSVGLFVASFALVSYVIIKMDQDPLLGCVFTKTGDSVSVRGAIGLLWSKFIAAAVILIPLLFPDVLSTLYDVLRSIDSLS